MKQYNTMKNESYTDVTTLINTVKELALSDLRLNNESTPFMIDDKLQANTLGLTKHGLGGHIQYVGINMNQDIYNMIKTIFHEARHIWQIRRFQNYTDKGIIKVLAGNGPKSYLQYWLQPVEIGARIYSAFAMKKYKRQIKQIISDYANGLLEEKLC